MAGDAATNAFARNQRGINIDAVAEAGRAYAALAPLTVSSRSGRPSGILQQPYRSPLYVRARIAGDARAFTGDDVPLAVRPPSMRASGCGAAPAVRRAKCCPCYTALSSRAVRLHAWLRFADLFAV